MLKSELIEKIKVAQSASARLEITSEQFKADLIDIVTSLSDYVNRLPGAPAYPEVNKTLTDSVGNMEVDSPLLQTIRSQVKGGIETASGNFMGYIPGGGLLAGVYADLIVGITNRFSGFHFTAPGAVNVENQVIQWMLKIFDLGENAWGVLTSGGTMATLNCFMSALEAFKVHSRAKLVIYSSDQTHHCILRVIKTLGILPENYRQIETDKNLKLNLNALRQQIELDKSRGLVPFIIVANAGTTNTGTIDPLDAISEVAKEHGIWLHIDAAYGGFFILTEIKHKQLSGIRHADSLVVDPHKGLFLAYGVGAALVKNKLYLRNAFSEKAAYLEDIQMSEQFSPAEFSFELTRHNRAPRIQLALDMFGEKSFASALEEKLLLARKLYEDLKEVKGINILFEPELSIIAFNASSDGDTRMLLDEILKDGTFYLSTTRIKDKLWIRICILSFRTHLSNIDNLKLSIAQALGEINE